MARTIEQSLSDTKRFSIVRELGVGAMGVVYEVFDSQRNITVALKTLKAADGRKLFRFKQEFRSLAALHHYNLIQLYELFADGDLWYFTMEFVDGSTFMEYVADVRASDEEPTVHYADLAQAAETNDAAPSGSALNSAGPLNSNVSSVNAAGKPDLIEQRTATETRLLDLAKLRESTRQLAVGLIELHSRGMLHRDIKPANVMVSHTGRVVLLDFGLVAEMNARATVDETTDEPPIYQPADIYETVEQGLAGTAAYMAPEQAQGKPVSPASDWYGVGTILYHALTGRVPFRGQLIDILRSKIKTDPPPPIEINPSIPRDFSDLCMRLLDRDARTRASGEDILALLGEDEDLDPTSLFTPSTPTIGIDAELPFVGRHRQLESLSRALRLAKSAATVIVEVHGASGMGKSSLVEHFLKTKECNDDTIVIQSRCYEQESVPYKAVDGLVDELTRYLLTLPEDERDEILPRYVTRLARLFPVLKRVKSIAERVAVTDEDNIDPRHLRQTAFVALGQLIDSITEEKTLVLSIDDMQWGDVDSAILINQLLRLGLEYRLLLIISYRVEYVETSACLRTLQKGKWKTGESTVKTTLGEGWSSSATMGSIAFRDSDFSFGTITENLIERVEIPILPLSPDSIRQLVQTLAPASSISDQLTEQIIKECHGNPYFALELVSYISAGNEITEDGGLVLDEVVWKRVLDLPETAQRVLQVVAIAGQPIPMRHVFKASRLDQLDPRDMRRLQVGRLIRSTGTGLDDEIATFHDRVRETVVAHIDAELFSRLHLRLAESLVDDPDGDPEMIANGFHFANVPERACEYYIRAAQAAADTLAFQRAAELYDLSLQLLPAESVQGTQRFALQKEMARSLARAGLGSEAAHEYQVAADLAEGRERVELEGLAAFHHATGGRIEQGRELLSRALAEVGLPISKSPMMVLLGLIKERFLFYSRGLKYTPRNESDVHPDLLLQIDTAGRSAKALSLFDPLSGFYYQTKMMRLALKAGEVERITAALSWGAATIATSRLRFETRKADQLIAKAKQLATQIENPYCTGIASLGEACLAFCTGQFKRGQANAIDAENTFRDQCTGVTWERDTAQIIHNWSLVFLGEFAELIAYSEAAVFDARERGDVYAATTHAVFSLAFSRLANGDPDGAQLGMDENMSQWSRSEYHVQHLFQTFLMCAIGIYRGRPERAWKRAQSEFDRLKKSMLLEVEILYIDFYSFVGRATLSGLFHNPTSAEFRKSAEQAASKLSKTSWGGSQSMAIRAGLASLSGQPEQAIAWLRQAITGHDKLDMAAHSATAKIQLGKLVGGDEGADLKKQGERFLTKQLVPEIPRMVDVLTPGFE